MPSRRAVAIAALLILAAVPTFAQVPRSVLIEEGGATWCVYCPRARAGVAVMFTRFDATEFDAIDCFDSSGGISCPDADARIAYYAVTGFPTLQFNGGSTIVGAGTDATNGSVYDPIVRSLVDDSTPLAMRISAASFVAGNGYVTVDMNLEKPLADISLTKLRVALVEDKVTYSAVQYEEVLRDMLPDQPLTISQAGESQQVTINFDVDPTWVTANLRAVAFVQNDADKSILQSTNSRPTPAYAMRYYQEGARTAIISGAHVFGETGLFNKGLNTDTYDVTLETAGLPAGWSAHLEMGGQGVPSASVTLAPDERLLFNVAMEATTPGQGSVVLRLHAQSGGTADRTLTYTMITPETRILLVDDDGASNFAAQYFAPAITPTLKSYGTWDRATSALTAADLAGFDMVIWECGLAYPTLDDGDRAALGAYLDGGGNLFITGQEIGWEADDTGGAALDWYHNYLHANFVLDDTNDMTITGTVGDPIGNGLSLTISGTGGANNQTYPDAISPLGTGASAILAYSATYTAGIKADTGTHKVVYLSFGYEAINTVANRALVMKRIVDWMLPWVAGVGDVAAAPGSLDVAPNPFNPRTEIAFSLPAAGPARLEVYDIRGRLVRVLSDGALPAGQQRVAWDGLDDSGQAVSSGTYLLRLETGSGRGLTRKLTVVR